MAGIYNNLTPILKTGVSNAIKVNNMFYGVDVKIYYPKDIKTYSGEYGDIEYDENPQYEGEVIIPEIYTIHQYAEASSFNYEFEEFTMYVDDLYIPLYSKIVAYTSLGILTYIVIRQDDYVTLTDKVASVYKIKPFVMDYNMLDTNEEVKEETTELINDLLTQFDEKMEDTNEEFDFEPSDELTIFDNTDTNNEDDIDINAEIKRKSSFTVL